jgi:hypothetical protein
VASTNLVKRRKGTEGKERKERNGKEKEIGIKK